MRLLVKLMTINERTDENGSMNWSDTGDRYILRLFRDFVFHQKDEQGHTVVDFGHIFDALAKLDAGELETIPLCSPDGKTLLVCSYNEIKQCLENSYQELFPQTHVVYHQPPQMMNYPNYMMMATGASMTPTLVQPVEYIPSYSQMGINPRGYAPTMPQPPMNRQSWM